MCCNFPSTANFDLMAQKLGCAQNPNGSLKEAHEIEFQYSRSPSPINLSLPAPPADPKLVATALDTKVVPQHGKEQKKKGRKPKVTTNSRRPITAALPRARKRNAMSYQDRIDILDFMEGPGENKQDAW